MKRLNTTVFLKNIRHNTIGLDYKSDVLYVSDTGVVANVPYEPKIEYYIFYTADFAAGV